MSFIEIFNNSKHAISVFLDDTNNLKLSPGQTEKISVNNAVTFLQIDYDIEGPGPANVIWRGYVPSSYLEFKNGSIYKDGEKLPNAHSKNGGSKGSFNLKIGLFLLLIVIVLIAYFYIKK